MAADATDGAWGEQAVQARCRAAAPGAKVEVLTLDLTAPYAELQAAAALADGAFGGAGIDYLVHNAGRRPPVLGASPPRSELSRAEGWWQVRDRCGW
jgi:NAD(P)-dependent dehydrogenase (short-subunit alcohol dehydrogenase family)